MVVKILPAVESSWKDVSGGGCGFAMATSESGKLITCGSTDDLGQIYVTSGKHCETPEPFPLPPEVCVQKAEAGWDHSVARAMKFIHGDGRNVYPLEECLDKWKEIRVK